MFSPRTFIHSGLIPQGLLFVATKGNTVLVKTPPREESSKACINERKLFMTSWHIGCIHMATFELFDFQRADCPNAWTLTGLYWTGALDFDLNSAHDTILIRLAMNPVIFGPCDHIYYVGHWVTQTSIQVLSVRCCSLTYGLMSIQSDASHINWCQHTYY